MALEEAFTKSCLCFSLKQGESRAPPAERTTSPAGINYPSFAYYRSSNSMAAATATALGAACSTSYLPSSAKHFTSQCTLRKSCKSFSVRRKQTPGSIRASVGTTHSGSLATKGKQPELTLYELLGISTEVSLDEIKRAYREKARQYHPDTNSADDKEECTKKFLLVQNAYEILGDPVLRADYDDLLRNRPSMQALKLGISYRKGRNRNQRNSGVDGADNMAWRSQWGSQLGGLKNNLRKQKPGSWAANLHQRQRKTSDHHGSCQMAT